MPRVIIIGAGISGLAFAKTYLQLTEYYASASPPKSSESSSSSINQSGIPKAFTSSFSSHDLLNPTESHDILIVDENSSLGGSWCRSRIYPNLYTQNALGTYEFSDMPLEGEDVSNEAGYIAGWKLEEYLVSWSKKWELTEKMRFGIKVNTVYRNPTTREWILNISHNPPREPLSFGIQESGRQLELYCDKLVLAVGTNSEPNRPYIPGQEFVDDGTMIHSVELGDWSRANLGIDVDYHHEPSAKPSPKTMRESTDSTHGLYQKSLESLYSSLIAVEEKSLPIPLHSPPTFTIPATPSTLSTHPKTVAIYGGRKSAFDIVYFFATLPENLRPAKIHWIFRPSASTPSRFAVPLVENPSPLENFHLPGWLTNILPTVPVPVRMDELMAVRLVGLFEKCGFESSIAQRISWEGVLEIIPGIGRFLEKGGCKNRDALGLQGRSWAGKFLHETKFGRMIVNGLWGALDKMWETTEGINEVEDGYLHKLRPGTSSGSCTTSFLITNQPGFWDIVRQPGINIYRTGIKSISQNPEEDRIRGGSRSEMLIQLDDDTCIHGINLLIMATGWKTNFPFVFEPSELQAQLGLPYRHNIREESSSGAQREIERIIKHWKSLETLAQQWLKSKSRTADISVDRQTEIDLKYSTLSLRLFRNMASPELTASSEKDRSLIVLGMAKSWQTMIVSEVQALWSAVYLLGGFDGGYSEGEEELNLSILKKDDIEKQIAVFEEFSRGTGGGVLLVDSLKYCDILLRDLGLCPWRKSMGSGLWGGWRDWVEIHRPNDYKGIVEEWIKKRKETRAEINQLA